MTEVVAVDRDIKLSEIGSEGTNRLYWRYFIAGNDTGDSDTFMRELYVSPIQIIPSPVNQQVIPGAEENRYVRRAGGLRFFCHEIKLCLRLSCQSNIPIQFHYAVLQPRSYNASLSRADVKRDFLTHSLSSTQVYRDFPPTDQLFDNQIVNHEEINKQKWNVIYRNMHVMSQQLNAGYPKYILFDKVIPINSVFEFEKRNTNFPVKPLVFVYWIQSMMPLTTTTNVVQCMIQTHSYCSDIDIDEDIPDIRPHSMNVF